jgi:hypothetical protein
MIAKAEAEFATAVMARRAKAQAVRALRAGDTQSDSVTARVPAGILPWGVVVVETP